MLSTESFELVRSRNKLVVALRAWSTPPLKINFGTGKPRDVLLQGFDGFEYFEIEGGNLLARIRNGGQPDDVIRPWYQRGRTRLLRCTGIARHILSESNRITTFHIWQTTANGQYS